MEPPDEDDIDMERVEIEKRAKNYKPRGPEKYVNGVPEREETAVESDVDDHWKKQLPPHFRCAGGN